VLRKRGSPTASGMVRKRSHRSVGWQRYFKAAVPGIEWAPPTGGPGVSHITADLSPMAPQEGAEFTRKSMKHLNIAGLVVSLLMMSVFALAGEGKAERIAVAANGQTPAAAVGKQPGRSPFFLIFDGKGAFLQGIENPYYREQAGGAGISVADFLANKGVTVLVAEAYGPKIIDVLKGKGIRAVTFMGTAGDAVTKLVGAK